MMTKCSEMLLKKIDQTSDIGYFCLLLYIRKKSNCESHSFCFNFLNKIKILTKI